MQWDLRAKPRTVLTHSPKPRPTHVSAFSPTTHRRRTVVHVTFRADVQAARLQGSSPAHGVADLAGVRTSANF